MKEVIVFAGGGTLGHILPALSMASALKKDNPNNQIIFMMTSKDERYDFIKEKSFIDQIYYYDINGLNRKNPIRNIWNFIKILLNISKIKEPLMEATMVIGMGGYISAIVIKLAKKLKKILIIHEQNKILGLANKIVINDVDLVLSAFPLDIKNKRCKVIGNPRLNDAKNYLHFLPIKNHILVTSGSLGSKSINFLIVEFLKTNASKKYFTTLITGKRYYEEIKSLLKEDTHYQILPFVDDLLEYMSKASLVISRAGASTIFEIIGLEKPAIIIPSPNVTGNHQYYNALFLKEQKACVLLEEKDLNLSSLNKYIEYAIDNMVIKDNLKRISKTYELVDWKKEIKDVRK